MLSFIIPAHNEAELLGSTLAAVMMAGHKSGQSFEVIVVDDASTDQTASIAAEAGARVIHVQNRQISATRNAGARAARGRFFFFVDADTLANPEAVRACLRELNRGAVGGGCVFRFDGVLPMWARIVYPVAASLMRLLKLVGGCFLFCTRESFEAVGGFSARYYAAEEVAFIRALQRRGRFAIPSPVVVTSGRKLRAYSGWRIARELWRVLTAGPEAYQRREALALWYEQRATD